MKNINLLPNEYQRKIKIKNIVKIAAASVSAAFLLLILFVNILKSASGFLEKEISSIDNSLKTDFLKSQNVYRVLMSESELNSDLKYIESNYLHALDISKAIAVLEKAKPELLGFTSISYNNRDNVLKLSANSPKEGAASEFLENLENYKEFSNAYITNMYIRESEGEFFSLNLEINQGGDNLYD